MHAQLIALRMANRRRQKEWDKDQLGDKKALFFAVELAGEVGEALNNVKKIEREQMEIAGSRSNISELGRELGDALICLDLLASCYNIDLAHYTELSFNEKTRKMGFNTLLDLHSP